MEALEEAVPSAKCIVARASSSRVSPPARSTDESDSGTDDTAPRDAPTPKTSGWNSDACLRLLHAATPATILGPSSSFPVQQESAPRRPLVVASRTAGQHPNQLGLPIPLSEVKLVQPVSACPPGLSMAPPCSRGSTPRRRAAPLREEAREDQNCAHELMLLSRCC